VGDIVNLRQARKVRARRVAADAATENRMRHGAPNHVKVTSEAETVRIRRKLENARREPSDRDRSSNAKVVPGDGIEPPTP
jgi:hypothetical protein